MKRRPQKPDSGHFLTPILVAALMVFLAMNANAAGVQARRGQVNLPTYPWAASKHPYFRGTDKVNIYPYPMLDFLSRDGKTNRAYHTVLLENEYLRITFLPELGGKIHEVIDKTTGQPMFYVNHVIKPGLIGQCGAWTSGGVEWNTGPQGHTVSAMQPVACEILPPEKDGSRSVAIGETERIYGTKWTVIVTLRPGRSFIEERLRIYNPTEHIRPYYFWNCTAMPNTPGFRFIYPMTLGTDHGSEKFFNWPIHEGKDLSRGVNYQDASSIFAWHCDQDFFGSYDDGVDRGVVSYANHHQVPGKKAWTWGQGGFGKMHQMDLTDTDGPYNEVQTGPLLTQGEVGRLDPCEAVEWKEWWYPVHGIGGFTFANRDVTVNARIEDRQLRLKIIGTGSWNPVEVSLSANNPTQSFAKSSCRISPRQAVDLTLPLSEWAPGTRLAVQLSHREGTLAQFEVPLPLPLRRQPEKKAAVETAHEHAERGWQQLLLARLNESESSFRKALKKDPKSAAARTGLACLRLDANPAAAASEAQAALEVEPDSGLARLVLAFAKDRFGDERGAMDDAWKSSLDPATAAAAQALVAKMLLRREAWDRVVDTLSAPGPWQTDALCRNYLSFAWIRTGHPDQANRLALANLELDPLDAFAGSILWLGGRGKTPLKELVNGNPATLLELIADYSRIGQANVAWQILDEFQRPPGTASPLQLYWKAHLAKQPGSFHSTTPATIPTLLKEAGQASSQDVFPWRIETVATLQSAVRTEPGDGKVALYLGHLLFHLGRYDEGREMWKKAAELGAEPAIACRALGMAASTLDGDLKSAREWLEKASQADKKDAIVARDLANVLWSLANQASDEAGKSVHLADARDRLKAAFESGKGRSDFIALLARVQNRLGEFAETARMLDQVRVTVWEGSHEVHDLYVEAHIALGESHLKAGRAAEALADFDLALQYPENLATGRLENAREARIHYRRGNALMALGQVQTALAAWRKAADEPAAKDEQQNDARRKAREAIEKATKQLSPGPR